MIIFVFICDPWKNLRTEHNPDKITGGDIWILNLECFVNNKAELTRMEAPTSSSPTSNTFLSRFGFGNEKNENDVL